MYEENMLNYFYYCFFNGTTKRALYANLKKRLSQ